MKIFFVQFFYIVLPPLLNILGPYHFCLYCVLLCMKCLLGITNWSFPFYWFPLFLCIDHWGRLSYLSLLFSASLQSVRYILPFLLCLSLFFFSQLFVRPHQTTILPLGMVLIPASCTVSRTSVHSSSGTLSIRSNPLNLFVTSLYNHKGFDLGHTWMV